jgi:hypothetical protein
MARLNQSCSQCHRDQSAHSSSARGASKGASFAIHRMGQLTRRCWWSVSESLSEMPRPRRARLAGL